MTAECVLRDADTGLVVVPHLEIARTVWQNTVGLIGRAWLASDAGLWLHPCNGIHTFGLRFAIDVLFLDGQGRVVRVVPDLKPCRICGPVWKAKTVVELPAGTLAQSGVTVGTRLELASASR